MDKKYYSTGEFAKLAGVSVRTIHWYDRQNVLKPSYRDENAKRFYAREDLAKLQQILLWKYLGFSLEDIREMTLAYADKNFLLESMRIQKKLVEQRMEEMREVVNALDETMAKIHKGEDLDYQKIIQTTKVTTLENALKAQYSDDANISARIKLHTDYSLNKEGWYPWLFRQYPLRKHMKILEVGCGTGLLWKISEAKIPDDTHIVLSDKSEGMLRDARNALQNDKRFSFRQFDFSAIPYPNDTFDMVIANHALFYAENLSQTLKEIHRVLKPSGILAASAYSKKHMEEIRLLTQAFNPAIILSEEPLYEVFGLDNGEDKLKTYFCDIRLLPYEDAIETNDAPTLISYILSCHGNQNHLLVDHFREFKEFVVQKTKHGFHITKDAGLFLCRKQSKENL